MRITRVLALSAAMLSLPAAATLDLAGIDKSVDPCTDFYAYVNGQWLKSAVIPEDRPDWGSFRILDERNLQTLKAALDDAMKAAPRDGSGRSKVLQYYASGLDMAGIEKAGLAPLKPHFDRIAAINGVGDLPAVLAALQVAGIDQPLAFSVQQDLKDATRYMPVLGQGGLGLPDRDAYSREDPRSQEVREAYRKYMARVLALAGDSPQSVAAQVETVMTLEMELAKAALTPTERRDVDKTYNRRTLARLVAH
jgi:predicted metalloendopeptidase